MKDKIKLIIYGDKKILDFLDEGLRLSEEIDIIGKVNEFDGLKTLLSLNQNVVVVFGSKDLLSLRMNETMEYFRDKNIQAIAICYDIRTGFLMLKEGASDMIIAPEAAENTTVAIFYNSLILKVKNAYRRYFESNTRVLKRQNTTNSRKIIAIGSSTGGTETILEIMQQMPEDVPPILIVQHMPPVFTKLFADRLNAVCKITVWEARDGDFLKPGLALVAPGDYQMTVQERNSKFCVKCEKGEKVNGHCPSVDVLFQSVAQVVGKNAVGLILTGMGNDGAQGLLSMREKGAMTIGQDEKSSVVYGMPKVAYDIGAVVRQASLQDIPRILLENI